MPHLPFNFVFPSRPSKTLSEKYDLELIHRWIIVKFEHQVRNLFSNIHTVENYEKMSELREISFAS